KGDSCNSTLVIQLAISVHSRRVLRRSSSGAGRLPVEMALRASVATNRWLPFVVAAARLTRRSQKQTRKLTETKGQTDYLDETQVRSVQRRPVHLTKLRAGITKAPQRRS